MNDMLCVGNAMRCVTATNALTKAVMTFPPPHPKPFNITKTTRATNLSLERGDNLNFLSSGLAFCQKMTHFPFRWRYKNNTSLQKQSIINKFCYVFASRFSINSTKSPASGAVNVSEPMLMSQVGEIARTGVRVDQCVSAVRAGLGASIGLLT